jgi:hypothetical protein
VVGIVIPALNSNLVEDLAGRPTTALAMDAVPRMSRAQSLDVPSSRANIAGHRAMVEAAHVLGRFYRSGAGCGKGAPGQGAGRRCQMKRLAGDTCFLADDPAEPAPDAALEPPAATAGPPGWASGAAETWDPRRRPGHRTIAGHGDRALHRSPARWCCLPRTCSISMHWSRSSRSLPGSYSTRRCVCLVADGRGPGPARGRGADPKAFCFVPIMSVPARPLVTGRVCDDPTLNYGIAGKEGSVATEVVDHIPRLAAGDLVGRCLR